MSKSKWAGKSVVSQKPRESIALGPWRGRGQVVGRQATHSEVWSTIVPCTCGLVIIVWRPCNHAPMYPCTHARVHICTCGLVIIVWRQMGGASLLRIGELAPTFLTGLIHRRGPSSISPPEAQDLVWPPGPTFRGDSILAPSARSNVLVGGSADSIPGTKVMCPLSVLGIQSSACSPKHAGAVRRPNSSSSSC